MPPQDEHPEPNAWRSPSTDDWTWARAGSDDDPGDPARPTGPAAPAGPPLAPPDDPTPRPCWADECATYARASTQNDGWRPLGPPANPANPAGGTAAARPPRRWVAVAVL